VVTCGCRRGTGSRRCGGSPLRQLPPSAALDRRQQRHIRRDRRGRVAARVVDMWAPWCGPAAWSARPWAAGADLELSQIKLVKVNVDSHPSSRSGSACRPSRP
jgi:hypothetical protein